MIEVKYNKSKKSKGKFCHLSKKDFHKLGLDKYYYIPLEKINFDNIVNDVMHKLKEEGFIFYDTVDYNYKLYDNKLIEFAVQFYHIK